MNCYSRGSVLAPIIICGEGAGRDEIGHTLNNGRSMKGASAPIPFAGPSGQLMQQILEWADIIEGDYLMTNVVSFFPTNESGHTRRPTEDEVSAEIERLYKEICLIKPKVIIAVGKTSLWALQYRKEMNMDEVRISEENGKTRTVIITSGDISHSVDIVPIFHPAAVLRAEDDDKKKDMKKAIASAFVKNKELLSKAIGRPLLIN